jgi:hypothetical protein
MTFTHEVDIIKIPIQHTKSPSGFGVLLKHRIHSVSIGVFIDVIAAAARDGSGSVQSGDFLGENTSNPVVQHMHAGKIVVG